MGEEVLKVVFIDLGLCIAVGLFIHIAKALFIKCNVCCIKVSCTMVLHRCIIGGRRGRDRNLMVVGLTTTYEINAYRH